MKLLVSKYCGAKWACLGWLNVTSSPSSSSRLSSILIPSLCKGLVGSNINIELVSELLEKEPQTLPKSRLSRIPNSLSMDLHVHSMCERKRATRLRNFCNKGRRFILSLDVESSPHDCYLQGPTLSYNVPINASKKNKET